MECFGNKIEHFRLMKNVIKSPANFEKYDFLKTILIAILIQ